MAKLLGLAWAAWKLSAKRLGPIGGAVFAGAVVVGFVLLREYLEDRYPALGNALDGAV